ncbi:MAG: glycosyltransferase family 2 protein [Cyclobacteriaceae bacterium]
MVSIITVNYNQWDVTLELLRDFGSYDPNLIEIIVVDNGSKHNRSAEILSLFPSVTVIRSEINLGFAGGNNLGIKEAKGEYLFHVNNDTIVSQETVMNLWQVLAENEEVAIACPLIYYYDDPTVIQYAGFTPINPWTGRNKAIGYKNQLKLSDKLEETSYAHGAAMMIKRTVVEKLGMMPENYFLYYEELDWVHQMTKSGYKVVVDHRSHILHKESISTGKSSVLKTYFQTRNRILFMRRNFVGFQRIPFMLFFTLISIPKYLFINLLKGKISHIESFLNGIIWNILNESDSNKLGYKFDDLRYN